MPPVAFPTRSEVAASRTHFAEQAKSVARADARALAAAKKNIPEIANDVNALVGQLMRERLKTGESLTRPYIIKHYGNISGGVMSQNPKTQDLIRTPIEGQGELVASLEKALNDGKRLGEGMWTAKLTYNSFPGAKEVFNTLVVNLTETPRADGFQG